MALKRFPGFIDPHVHLREPGATYKEDFYTGSRAAASGGFTFILDMPNNPLPTISMERLEEKVALSQKAIIDIGFNYGTNGKNIETFRNAWENPHVFGLKLYCNHTTGEMLIEDRVLLEKVFQAWESSKPILLHAEGAQLQMAIEFAKAYNRRIHACHVSLAMEVDLIRQAKADGVKVTAGVCPHHLYLTVDDIPRLKGYGVMKPPLATKEDQEALWKGIQDKTIDLVETDHAPHTKEEKEKDQPAFGVPGLESAAPLMFLAVKQGRIQEQDVVRLLHDAAKDIFNIPDQPDTYLELDPDAPFIFGQDGYETKCGWSPFEGMEMYGKVQTVVFKGKIIVSDGKVV